MLDTNILLLITTIFICHFLVQNVGIQKPRSLDTDQSPQDPVSQQRKAESSSHPHTPRSLSQDSRVQPLTSSLPQTPTGQSVQPNTVYVLTPPFTPTATPLRLVDTPTGLAITCTQVSY